MACTDKNKQANDVGMDNDNINHKHQYGVQHCTRVLVSAITKKPSGSSK